MSNHTTAAPYQKRSNPEYDAYRQGPRWKKLARLVMLRAKGQCEICLRRRGAHAAHLTYERIFHELPTDVVWVCAQCHDELDERKRECRTIPLLEAQQADVEVLSPVKRGVRT
jgi:hypothetical protein